MALFSLLNSGFLIFYISIAKSRRIETSQSPFSFSFLPLKSFTVVQFAYSLNIV